MAIFFKTRAKVQQLPPLHRDLTLQQTIGCLQPVEGWKEFLASVDTHYEVTGGKIKYALPKTFVEVGLPMLKILIEDARRGTPVGLAVMSPDAVRPVTEKVAMPDMGRRRGVKQQWFRGEPLRAEATLADGSRLLLQVGSVHRARSWRQSSSSGKIKFKSRTKKQSVYRVTLSMPPGSMPQQPASPPPSVIQTRVDMERRRPRVQARAKALGEPNLATLLDVATEVMRWSRAARMTGHDSPEEPR